MEISGICSMCGGHAKRAFTCSMCGTTVCMNCFNPDVNLCRRCTAQSRKGF